MGYAEVSVNSPAAQRRTFSYAVPPALNIEVGQAVLVPFGDKLLQGVVLELTERPAVEETRDITGVIDPRPFLSPAQVGLATWISQHYLSPLFDAVALMLPPGFERKPLTFVSPRMLPDNFDLSSLSQAQRDALDAAQKQGRVSLGQLEKSFGKKNAQNLVSQLVRHGLVTRHYELEPVKVKAKVQLYLSLAVSAAEVEGQLSVLRRKNSKKQADLLGFLTAQPGPVALAEAMETVDCSRQAVNALVNRGLVTLQSVETSRDPLSHLDIRPSSPPVLTPAQDSAFRAIQSALKESSNSRESAATFLLHGVTGSGKTEVYLRALEETVRLGRRGIVLVPEIALTPQTVERFVSRFPGRVAVLHSQLSLGERFDEWYRIRNGEFDVVVGARSAIFAPQPRLGLIVVDEEHEWNYKQNDQSPRYHARDVTIRLAALSRAVVVLGSATPDVETYYRAQRGEYRLLKLPERVTPAQNSPLPAVEVVDMSEEIRSGNRGHLSRSLSQSIAEAVDAGEQVILFLNRRGAATFVQCRNCGFVLRCKRCEVSLTYHLAPDVMVCHQCNYRTAVPRVCPRCQSPRIKLLGTGTQKVEQETGQAFPAARLLRWDSDAVQQKHSHEEILNSFRDRHADILIGTQMVTKGLDLPGVTVVGVINADTGLNLPDFRAGERAFQLLIQVAGRAGRGPGGGRVIIQTYSPEHYAIRAAARHDYLMFYEKEIAYRRQLRNPPFTRLASLVYSHTGEAACRREAERMKRQLVSEKDARGVADLEILGPAPAFVARVRGRFRWQLILRASDVATFLEGIPFPRGWTVDIDPVGLS